MTVYDAVQELAKKAKELGFIVREFEIKEKSYMETVVDLSFAYLEPESKCR